MGSNPAQFHYSSVPYSTIEIAFSNLTFVIDHHHFRRWFYHAKNGVFPVFSVSDITHITITSDNKIVITIYLVISELFETGYML